MRNKLLLGAVVLVSSMALAAPPGDRSAKWDGVERGERLEDRARETRLMFVVAISEALELNESDALKLADRFKSVDERRRPLRQQMGEAMKSLRDAAEGDAAALPQVDANVQRVLDGRAQLAALDKELFASLAQGLTPQKRAKLALVLAKMHHEFKGKKGRHHQRN